MPLPLPLRRLTPVNSEWVIKIHEDIYTLGTSSLRVDEFIIFEELTIRAGYRKHRALIQWDVLRQSWQKDFGRDLLGLSRNNLRQMITAEFDRIKVTKEVDAYLGKGNGNQQAGFGFPNWNRSITERQIAARQHVARGFNRSARRIRSYLDKPSTSLLTENADENPNENLPSD
jgi:hypothetical protein